MASSTSSIDGLISGLDTTALIDNLMSIEKQPRDLLATQQATQQKAIDAAKAIETKLTALSLAAGYLQRSSGWMLRTGTTTDDSVATVSADAGAAIAGFSFTVDVLATAHGVVTNTSVAGTDTVIASGGSISLTVGGESTVVSVGGGTLSEVATAINDAAIGVRAAIVNTGSGYRLQLTSSSTGAASEFTVDSGLDAGVGGTSITSQGTDAKITIGSGPGAYSVTSSSNRFANIVPGVSVTVKKTSATPVTVGVAADTEALAKSIQAMVDAANDALAEITAQTKYDAATKTASPLTGDTAVRRLAQNLTRAVTEAVSQSSLVSPGLAGVSVDRTGKVTFDKGTFLDAYAKDPAAVERLFVQGATSTGSVSFNFAGNTVPAGSYDVVVTSGPTTATIGGGLAGGWTPGGEPTVKVRQSGREVSYAVQPTDDIDAVRAGLQAALDADDVAVDVTVDAGALVLTARTPGSAASFEASWDGGTTWNPAAGVDAIGTIGGETAYGNGTTFGIPPSAAKWGGLSVTLSTSATGAVGSFTYEPGLAQRLITAVRDATDDGTGYLASSEQARQARIDQLTSAISSYDLRLAKRQQTLKAQFAALEVALGNMKSQSEWLAGQLNSLSNLSASSKGS
jgi:flagellar hook-associated protein 2